MKYRHLFLLAVVLFAWESGRAPLAAQTLETETARLLRRGALKFATNLEWQTSSEGRELAIPLAVEYGLGDRWELLVEPVPYTSIRPRSGRRTTGAGDIEITLTSLVRRETSGAPAVALGAEVKVPTGRNALIGTGGADFAAYAIASKRLRRLDLHANLGYTFVGSPSAVGLRNIVNGAVAGVLALSKTSEVYAELLAGTSSSNTSESAGPVSGAAGSPEAAGGEIVGTVGVGHYVLSALKLSFGLSYDNNGAFLFRPGFVFRIK